MGAAIGYAPGSLARYAGWHRATAPRLDDEASPFARLLGERWLFLPPATRRRFLRKIAPGACVSYLGEVAECRMSLAGRVLASA